MKLLVLDIETDSLDINTANIKWLLGYDPQTNKFETINYEQSSAQDARNYIMKYDKIITFNGNQFDIPILKRHKILIDGDNGDFYCNYFIKGIDIYEIFKKRATLIFPRGFKSLSMRAIAKDLFPNSDIQKGEIDYNIFKKKNSELTEEEISLIKKYGEMDVLLTWKLWEYLVEKFKPFSEFLTQDDVYKFKHISSSIASYGYKAICKEAGITELWGDTETEQDKYIGAYVMQPTKISSKENILYLDFASLYPMLYVHANLFSSNCQCCTQEEKWHGSDRWQINGYYCKNCPGKIESVIKKFYLLRKSYKKIGDSREQAIKIILNSLYGSSSRPGFIQTYSPTTASDCTSLGQQVIKYAITRLEQDNYGKVLYADTDSVFLELSQSKTKEQCLEFCKELSTEISQSFPFPWEEFNLKLESEIKYLQFFKDDLGQLKKKNYLYIDKNNKLVIKGLDIIQRDCSKLSQLIFEKYLQNQIIGNLNCKFDKEYILNLIKNEIQQDYLLIAKKFNIRFKYKCDTTLYNQILQMYGPGEYFLVKNFKIGAGKDKKYCSLEEAKQLQFEDLDLSDVNAELEPFIKIEKQFVLCNFGITKENAINII